MNPADTFPKSANDKFIPVKFIGRGKDGIVVLAVLKEKPNDPASRPALKFLGAGHTTRPKKEHLDALIAMQDDSEHPLPKILKYAEDLGWHTMEFVKGQTVIDLRNDHYRDGFPPYLVLRVFEQVVQQELYLQRHGWCHIDLSGGANTMLQNSAADTAPSVTLVDFEAVQPYAQFEDQRVLKHVVGLIVMMTKGVTRVPQEFRRRKDGSAFDTNDLAAADKFYKLLTDVFFRNRWNKEKTLEEMWREHGAQLIQLAADLTDEGIAKEIESILSEPVVTDKEVEEVLANGGMKMKVHYD